MLSEYLEGRNWAFVHRKHAPGNKSAVPHLDPSLSTEGKLD